MIQKRLLGSGPTDSKWEQGRGAGPCSAAAGQLFGHGIPQLAAAQGGTVAAPRNK
jgi:hypothetical protein